MDYYELMHRDVVVAVFIIDDTANVQVSFDSEWEQHLPLAVSDRKTFIKWLKNRAIPVTRHGIDKITNDTFQFMLANLGLSLTDNYWIRRSDMECTWDAVNFYRNSFQSSVMLDNLESINLVGQTNFTPSASLVGDLKKKWILAGDTRILVKGNCTDTALQAISEVIASKIYDSLGVIPFSNYQFIPLVSNGKTILGCGTPNFTDEDLEFVPAIDIVNSVSKRNDESYYQMFVRLCEERGITGVKHFLDVMLSVDFLIANTDRHLNNFGILRNPVTLEWVSMAPVFDSGNSLFYKSGRDATLPSGKSLLQTEITSFFPTMIRQMSVVDTSVLDVSKLPSIHVLESIIRNDNALTERDVEQRLVLMTNLQKYFVDLQNGKQLWKYDEMKVLDAF